MNQRQKHTLIAALVGLLGIILILIVVWFFSREHRFTKYHNEENDFSISYPALWERQENVNGAAVIFLAPKENELDFFRESVNIVVQDLTNQPLDLMAYSDLAIDQMKLVFEDNFILLESGVTVISGTPGYRIVFLGKGPDLEMKYMCTWTIKDDTAYQITYTTISSQYDLYAFYVKRMLMSFRLN